MKNALIIARYELRRIFVSPLAWTVLAVIQLIAGFGFARSVVDYASNPDMVDQYTGVSEFVGQNLFGLAIFVLLLVMPLMTMRLFAEERKSGSIDLLFSAPVSLIEIVLGKFLGLAGFMLATLALVALMPLSLLPATALDLGRIGAGLFGLLLIMLAFGSAGMFMSSLTREATIAAVGGFGLLLLIWLIEILSYGENKFAELFSYLSLISHYQSLLSGVFNTADVAYYLLFTALFLWLTVQRLDMERN